MYTNHMSTRPVQISFDEELLKRVDADPDVQQHGRSAVVRRALLLYLRAKERRSIDQAIQKAYAQRADDMFVEVEDLMDAQAWPER